MSVLFALALSAAAPAGVPAAPPAPTASPAPAGGSTLQSDFDAASRAAEADDCAKAVPLFEALERDPRLKPGSLPAAAVSVRKGTCLLMLKRTTDGEQAILAGLPGLERAGTKFDIDISNAYLALGNAAYRRWDYGAARRHYEKALAQQVTELRPTILAALARAGTFDDDAGPLRYVDEGIRIVSAQPKPPKDALAGFYTLKARILLNRGDNEAAYTLLKQALALSGGLTLRTSLTEAAMRSDLALAALLVGKKDDARRYLAYTGAGRIAQSPFAVAASMGAPDCGGDTGLRPEDFAVVEFGIADDGSVSATQTIYSRGGPRVAAAFAEAVSKWYWRPEMLAKIPVFYRASTRVELRCSTAEGPSPGITKPLFDRFGQWASAHVQVAPSDDVLMALRRQVAAKQASGDLPGQVAATGVLAIAEPRTGIEIAAMLERAIALPRRTDIPVEAVNTLRIVRLLMTPIVRGWSQLGGYKELEDKQLLDLARTPDIAADPLAAATLQLLTKEPTTAMLQQIAEREGLPVRHPLRNVALLKLANRAAAAGDLAAAQGYFQKTGLTEQQCALVGAKPALRRSGADSGDFPREAMMYGFEGWVTLQFDIAADGRTANTRPLIAYPPFVFVDAAKGMTRDIRYETTYRPSGGVACNANNETIRFILP